MKYLLAVALLSAGCATSMDQDEVAVYYHLNTTWRQVKILASGPHDLAHIPKVFRFVGEHPEKGMVDFTYQMKDCRIVLFRMLARKPAEPPVEVKKAGDVLLRNDCQTMSGR